MATITRSIQHKRDTAANFTSNNPILLEGQLAIETDGLLTTPKYKIGDGVTAWSGLPYASGGSIGYTAENVANKDATGGYAGLTLFKINFKNALNTFTSFFTNSNTAARTYTFQDKDCTIAATNDTVMTNSRNSVLTAKNFTPASGTNTTGEEILHSLQVASSTMASGDMMEVYFSGITNSTAGTKTFRIYINTTNTLSGAVQIGLCTPFTTGVTAFGMHRFYPVISDTSLGVKSGGTTADVRVDFQTLGTTANIAVTSISAGFFIIISGQKTVGTDTDTVQWSMVRNSRL